MEGKLHLLSFSKSRTEPVFSVAPVHAAMGLACPARHWCIPCPRIAMERY